MTESQFIERFNCYIKGRKEFLEILYFIVNIHYNDGEMQNYYFSGLKRNYIEWKNKGIFLTYSHEKQSLMGLNAKESLDNGEVHKISILIPKGKAFSLFDFKIFIISLGLEDYNYNKQRVMVHHKNLKYKYFNMEIIDPVEADNYLLSPRTLIEFSIQ